MKKRTLFITVFHSFITKNILNTDVFKRMREVPDLDIVLLVLDNKKEFYDNLYTMPGVTVVGIPITTFMNRRVVKFFSYMSHLLMNAHYLWYKKGERLERNKTLKGYIKYYGEVFFTKLFSGSKTIRKIYRYFFLKTIAIKEIADVFEQYKPDVVFSSDAFDETDVLFQRETRIRNIPLISMVRSWDNCYSKGIMRVVPDELIVNTQTLKDEAVTLHDMLEDTIHIGGLPQFDRFVTEPRTPREEFFKLIGADPKKKLIVFAPAGKILSDTDWQLADILKKAIQEKKFIEPIQIFVRNHPNHPAEFPQFQTDENFIFEMPGKVFNPKNPKETELTLDDVRHLADLLYHAEIVMYVATTLGIDSLHFDKPQIFISFDGYEQKTYINSVRKYLHEDHMAKMLSCGGVSIVKSSEEWIDAINAYLKDPSLHHEGRVKTIEQQLFKIDGNAGKRVGNFVVEAITRLVRV